MSVAGEPARVLDVRLLAPALGAWTAVALGVLTGADSVFVLSLSAVAAAVLVCVRHGRERWATAVLATLLTIAGFAAATALHARSTANNPLRHTSGSLTLELVLTDDPRTLSSALPGAPAQVLVRDDLVADGARRLTGAVVVLAPARGWTGLLPGQHVRTRGKAAPPSRRDLTVASIRVRDPPTLVGRPAAAQRAAGSLRTGLRDAALSTLGPETGALLPGLVVGDTSALSQRVLDDAKTAGLTHLTAVSGMNITLVMGAVLLLVRAAGAGPRTSAALAAMALAGFVVLARPSPSVLRAAVMGTVALLALVTGRRRQALPALCGAVLVLRPALAVDVGFALSVLATGALVLLAPRWVAALRRRGVPAGVAELLAVPAAAHLVTAPVIAGLSGKLSLVAVLANLLVAPVVGPATVLGVAATVALPVWAPLGRLLVRLAGPEVWWLVQVGRRCAELPGAAIEVPGGAAGALGLAAVVVAVLVAARNPAVRGLVLAVVLGVSVVWVPTRTVTPGWPATGWAVVACDVGQGDAVVLSLGPHRAVVVDTGPEPAAVAGCLDRLHVTEVALVVLTHLHADHVGGLEGVLQGRSVGAVAVGPLRLPGAALSRVRARSAAHGVPLVDLAAGASLVWPGLRLDVLGPVRPVTATLGSDPGTVLNDASLVLSARTTVGRVLLTGDAELAEQGDLLAARVDLRADVLKVPHHGSRFSAPAFLDSVGARVALVSVGQGNAYGHPNAGVLEHLAARGTTVGRTDTDGDVAVAPGPGGPVVVRRGDPRPPP
ncbi:MAG: ComEC/Rec2 family competence protein [Mycobacteriaceae bacterium]